MWDFKIREGCLLQFYTDINSSPLIRNLQFLAPTSPTECLRVKVCSDLELGFKVKVVADLCKKNFVPSTFFKISSALSCLCIKV